MPFVSAMLVNPHQCGGGLPLINVVVGYLSSKWWWAPPCDDGPTLINLIVSYPLINVMVGHTLINVMVGCPPSMMVGYPSST